jgi:hypothetical protein
LPDNTSVIILFGNTKADHRTAAPSVPQTTITRDFLQSVSDTSAGSEELKNRMIRQFDFYNRLIDRGLGDNYEAAHARLAFESFAAAYGRRKLLKEGKLQPLSGRSQEAVDQLYLKTAETLCTGIENAMKSSNQSITSQSKKISDIFQSIKKPKP